MAQAPKQIVTQKGDELPLPSASDLLLLKACLLSTAGNLNFTQWRSQVNFETEVGRGAFRLLPLLYFRYRNTARNDEVMARLKGIYRNSWSKNNMLLFTALPALGLLTSNGIRLLLLKGLPMAQLYYKNMALRPMADVDILVQEKDREIAVDLLMKEGYTVKEDAPLNYIFRALRSITLVKNDLEIDLHWSPLIESFGLKKEHLFWQYTQNITIGEYALETLDTTGHLFHTIVHGFKRNPEPPIRWIADAVYLLEAQDRIDWDRLWQLGFQHGVLLQLKQAFTFLLEELQQPIPITFSQKLETFKPNYSQKLLYHYALTDGWQFEAPTTFRETVRMHYFLHLRKTIHQAFIWQNVNFIGYTLRLVLDTPRFFLSRFSRLLYQSLRGKK